MSAVLPNPKPLSKKQMLERLQFSKNLQVAIKARELLTSKLTEDQIFGGFLSAVLKNDYQDAMIRADDHNKAALLAANFSIGRLLYFGVDHHGYHKGKLYWMKLTVKSGQITMTPPVATESDELTYANISDMMEDWYIA